MESLSNAQSGLTLEQLEEIRNMAINFAFETDLKKENYKPIYSNVPEEVERAAFEMAYDEAIKKIFGDTNQTFQEEVRHLK